MKFTSQRLFNTNGNPKGDYSLAHLTNREGLELFVIEDDKQDKKIPGVTRIPSGLYLLGLRKEDTPLTIKHREAYAKHMGGWWFKENPGWYHIEVMNIPNYTGVYFHSGTDDSHTLGCQLLCFGIDLEAKENPGSKSVLACSKFYSIVYPLLLAGEKVPYEVKDEVNY